MVEKARALGLYEFQAVSGPECQLIGPITAPQLRFVQVATVPEQETEQLAICFGD